MKTLKEYAEFLYSKGYKETELPYEFLDSSLQIVSFEKGDWYINLHVQETEEFSKFLESLEEGTEYEIDYKNYVVCGAFLKSPICNVSNFYDGSTEGIELVAEPNQYNKHTLDIFEPCVDLQSTNLLNHDLFIMTCRQEQLKWAKDNLIPVLERYDYACEYDSFFSTEEGRSSSNIRIDFKHPNGASLTIETDCLTGKPIIWSSVNVLDGYSDLTSELYGKSEGEVFDILFEKVWEKHPLRFGYIYNNDPQETVKTFQAVMTLMDCIEHKEKASIDLNLIPERYKYLVEEYESLNLNI